MRHYRKYKTLRMDAQMCTHTGGQVCGGINIEMKITHANILEFLVGANSLRSLKSLYLSTSIIDEVSEQVRHKPGCAISEDC